MFESYDDYAFARDQGAVSPQEEEWVTTNHPEWASTYDSNATTSGKTVLAGTFETDTDDGEDQTTAIPLYKGWSYTDRYGFEQTIEWITQHTDTSGLSTTLIDAFANEWALKWRAENGYASTESIEAVPTLAELMQDQRFVAGVFWLPATASGALPPVFRTAQEKVDEDGNPTGEFVALIALPDPLTGVQFIEETTVTGTGITGGTVINNRDIVNAIVASQVPGLAQEVQERTAETDVAHFLEKRGLLPGAEDESTMPLVPMEQLVELVTPEAPSSGTGSATRRDIVFDRKQLVSQVADLYNSWFLRAGDAPQGIVGNIVDRYIREAKAFWSGKGGQLDFDTYVRDALRALPRYDVIYQDKTPQQSEEAFLSSFQSPISQLGLSGEDTRRQTFAAVTSGASPASQFARVARSEEAERQNVGGFAQRLAATVKGLGAGIS